MGNKPLVLKEQKLLCDHPLLKDVRVVHEAKNQYIEAKFKIQKKAYNDWHASYDKSRKSLKSEYLMMPIDIDFTGDQVACGDSGTAVVSFI